MDIIMKKQTLYKGDTLKVGDKKSIEDKIASRWVRNKIAVIDVVEKVAPKVMEEATDYIAFEKVVPETVEVIEEETQEVTEDVPLFGLCNNDRTSDIPRDSSKCATNGRNKTTHKSKRTN